MEINLKINFPSESTVKNKSQIPKSLKVSYVIDFTSNNNDNNNDVIEHNISLNNPNLNKNIVLNLKENEEGNLEINKKDNNLLHPINKDNKIDSSNNDTSNKITPNINNNNNNDKNSGRSKNNNQIDKDDNNIWDSHDNDINTKWKKKDSRSNSLKRNLNNKKSRDNSINKYNSNFKGRGEERGYYAKEKISTTNISKNEDNTNNPADANEELFVMGIREGMTENNLKQTFSKYGKIELIKILKDKLTKKNKHVGFVKFLNKESSFKAMMDADNIICNGKKLKIKYNNRRKGKKYFEKNEQNVYSYKGGSEQSNDCYSWDMKSGKNSKLSKNRGNNEDNESHYGSYRERSRGNDKKDIDDW